MCKNNSDYKKLIEYHKSDLSKLNYNNLLIILQLIWKYMNFKDNPDIGYELVGTDITDIWNHGYEVNITCNYGNLADNCSSTTIYDFETCFIDNTPRYIKALIFRILVNYNSKNTKFVFLSDSKRNNEVYDLIPFLKRDGFKVVETATNDGKSKIRWVTKVIQ